MRITYVLSLVVAVVGVLNSAGAADDRAGGLELVEVHKIWDRAPHNAFTDLIRFQDTWFVAFREAATHGYTPPLGKIRVICSRDGRQWESTALLEYGSPEHDLRDAKLTITPDGRLMLNAAVVPPEARNRRQSLVWFSRDGHHWQGPHEIGEPNWWLWRAVWHPDGTVYGLGYGDITRRPRTTRLYHSKDGIHYRTLVPTLTAEPETGESAMLFRKDGTAVLLVRRDGKEPRGLVGTSRGNYTQWTFRDLGVRIGGPAILELPDGQIIAATRRHDGTTRTSLGLLDPEAGMLTEQLALPSGGDSSYPGLVWHDNLLWVSYYSSHEGKTSIYLAKVKVDSAKLRRAEGETGRPRIETKTFLSNVLGVKKRFCVVLPEDYDPAKKEWPVLYLLHGRGRHERSLVDDAQARAALLVARFVVVLPDGDDGWYIDSPERKADRYASYLDEVIRMAEVAYDLSRSPQRRAISGWSMGGYGCMRYAVDHPGQFAAVAPIIGLLDFPRDGLPDGQSYKVPTERFGSDLAMWKRFNPISQVKALRGASLLLITADRAFDRTMNENFRARLEACHLPHRWVMLEGGHTFDVVRAALPTVVEHVNRVFASNATK